MRGRPSAKKSRAGTARWVLALWARRRPSQHGRAHTRHDRTLADGLVIDTYGQLMRQHLLARTGPTIGAAGVPGNPAESLLIEALTGTADDLPRMRFGAPPLPKADIVMIENWIRKGANDN